MSHNSSNKESSYLKYWDVNDLYGWKMSQKLLVNKCELIKDTSQFNEEFIIKKTIIQKVLQDIFSKLMFNILKMIYHFYHKELKLKKSKSLLLIHMIKLNMLFT